MSNNAAFEFLTEDTVSLFSASLPAPTVGAEIANDPEWAQKIHRALEQSERGEGRPWREFKSELMQEEQGQ